MPAGYGLIGCLGQTAGECLPGSQRDHSIRRSGKNQRAMSDLMQPLASIELDRELALRAIRLAIYERAAQILQRHISRRAGAERARHGQRVSQTQDARREVDAQQAPGREAELTREPGGIPTERRQEHQSAYARWVAAG